MPNSRQPQGVYRISATDGQPELVVAGGYAARFSPNGKALVIGSAGKLVAHPQPEGAPYELLPQIHLLVRDLMIEMEQDEGHIVGAHGEQRARVKRYSNDPERERAVLESMFRAEILAAMAAVR